MIRVEDALNCILGSLKPLGLEKVSILDSLGRVIGEDIVAQRDIPPMNNSAMDGYAVCAEDTKGATRGNPVIVKVVEDIPAGAVPRTRINRGEAARIMTGAPIPEGANAVVRVEDTEKAGDWVKIYVEIEKGQDIRCAGEDVQKGERVISRGDVIRPAEVGMLAALGRSFVSVYQKPRVAVIATGDEIVDVDETPSPWQIVNSNGYSLTAQIIECGAVPLNLGIAKDTKESLVETFGNALRADVIISSGGVSVGDYDFVKDIMTEIGNQMHFWQVAMRPGKPLAFGSVGGIPLFGLPGNPVSSMVSFEQFVRPSLLMMMGHKKIFRKTVRALCKENIEKKKGTRHFLRARVMLEKGKYTVATTGEQGSGILKSMVMANGLIVLPEDASFVRAGDEVTVQLLDRSFECTELPEYL